MAIENSDISRLVARLVLGYLDEQNLSDAYDSFYQTSRHFTKQEYVAFTQGIKTIDTSIGLVNIITEYFLIKEKFNEFLRTCPQTSLIINLIDISSFQLRLELIFKVLKANIGNIDCTTKNDCAEVKSRKRKKDEDDLFEVCGTNTSTPETAHQSKRRRISLATSVLTLSANNTDKKNKKEADQTVLNRKELNYISSPDTSYKEDDVTEDDDPVPTQEPCGSGGKIEPLPPELLCNTILQKADFAENLAEIINQTRSAKEIESSDSPTNQNNIVTPNEMQDILSKTENDFEDILKEVINKFLVEDDKLSSDVQSSTSPTDKEDVVKPQDVPLKQRLRPRITPKAQKSERKKKKINIISNEAYTGPLPACLQIPSTSTAVIGSPFKQPTVSIDEMQQHIVLVPIVQPLIKATTTLINLQTFNSLKNEEVICESDAKTNQIPETSSNIQLIVSNTEEKEIPPVIDTSSTEINVGDKNHQTPKASIPQNFLESKCKSTPRRKASHVRILNFAQTPSLHRLSVIKEFATPSNGIKLDTPGSAPASITVTKRRKTEADVSFHKKFSKDNLDESIEMIDDSSNSNSISHTPKVAKNRRRRKIEVDSKLPNEEESSKPITKEEWDKMREQQKKLSVDDRMRIFFQENEQKNNTKKRKTPKKKQSQSNKKSSVLKSVKKIPNSPSNEQQSRKLINSYGAKFKVTSPRKAMLRKTPKKKKIPPVQSEVKLLLNGDNKTITTTPIAHSSTKIDLPKLSDESPVIEEEEKVNLESSDLNRSDTVQEVATLLTNLPETILAKTNSGNFEPKSAEKNDQQENSVIDSNFLLETPLKFDSISPLPNTPRFAVPILSTHQETPMSKAVTNTVTTAVSILKVCDILTPSFPITPGFKETPGKSDPSPASGYSSRRTDYSSCSSYYKPDESEDINQNFDQFIKQSRSERNSQSESDGGFVATSSRIDVIKIGSAKKVDCPGALDRVSSFTEENKEVPMPHYTMMEDGLLSESMVTTGTDESSSSFTCSTCSTDPSSEDEDNTMKKLDKAANVDDRDSEWQCDDLELEKETVSNNSLVDELTGEVRFPFRNWITPKKTEPESTITSIIEETKHVIITANDDVSLSARKKEEKRKILTEMEEKKQRTLRILKNESAANAKRIQPKMKKSNAKAFKLPPEQPRQIAVSRRDQILQQNLSERPRPTPLKLIPSSSSRRKNATPRKTIIIDELPKAPSPIKKSKKAKSQERRKSESSTTSTKSPAKPERVSFESINDNAVMQDDHPSLNISSSFNQSSDEEHEENTIIKKITERIDEEGSNTFQKTLIAQGFDKNDAKDLQIKFVDKIEEERKFSKEKSPEKEVNLSVTDSETDEESEDECTFTLSDVSDKNIVSVEEPLIFIKSKKEISKVSHPPPSKLQVDNKTIKIDVTEVMDLFSLDPVNTNGDNKPTSDDTGKGETLKGKLTIKPLETKGLTKEIPIDKILSMIHGNH